MTLKNLFLLLLGLFAVGSCKKDHFENTSTESSRRYELNETERRFFNLHNTHFLLNSAVVSGRSEFPASLLRVYNDMIASNDEHHFVTGVVERIGYPLWEGATVDISFDNATYMVQLPFVKPNVSGVQAILTCLIPEQGGDIRYSVQSKRVLEDILAGEAAIGPETCRSCMEFGAFNYTLFGEESALYKELTCEACFPDGNGGQFKPGNELLDRSCQTVQTTYCIWDQPNGPLPTTVGGTGGGGGGDGGGWFTWSPAGGGYMPGDLVFIGPFGGGNDGSGSGGGGSGSGINLDGFVSGIFGGIGSFFRDLFTRGPKCPKWKFTEPNGDLTARNGDVVYVCQTFTNIMCYNGGWWEVVESWPCPECDGNLTLEEYHAMQCQQNLVSFLNGHNIVPGIWRKYVGNMDCCIEEMFDKECGLRALFEGVGLSEGEVNTVFTLGLENEVISYFTENGFNVELLQIIKIGIELLELNPAIDFNLAISLAAAAESIGGYDIEEDMPSTNGWLSCESFEYSMPIPNIYEGGVDALFFSWYIPQMGNYKTVGPFNMDVRFQAPCTKEDAEWSSAWAANRAAKIVGFVVIGEPMWSNEAIKNAFISVFKQGLVHHTPQRCRPINTVEAYLASNYPSRTTAIYYSIFLTWLVHCGF